MKSDIQPILEEFDSWLDNVSNQSRAALGQAPFLIFFLLSIAKPPNITNDSVGGLVLAIALPSRYGDPFLHLCVANYLDIDPNPGMKDLLLSGSSAAECAELVPTISAKAHSIGTTLIQSARSGESLQNKIMNLYNAITETPESAQNILCGSIVTIGSLILREHRLKKRFLRPVPPRAKLVAEIAEDPTLHKFKKIFEISDLDYVEAVKRGVTA
jgi:hypothetical protein